MARAMQTINVGDWVFISDPNVSYTYGKVVSINGEVYTVETALGQSDIEAGYLELDELPF